MNRIDTFIASALEEFVADTARLLDAAHDQKPLDKDEIAFWKAQRNAFAKAQHYFLNGARLTATPSGYTVPSASRPGCLIHRLYRVGGVWHCTCEAGTRGIFHWHAAMVHAYERGHELADLDGDSADDAGKAENGKMKAKTEDPDFQLSPFSSQLSPPPTPISLTQTPSGLVLSHHGVTELAASPADVARAIGKLTTPAALGTRIAVARARLLAA